VGPSPLAEFGVLGEDRLFKLREIGYHKIVVPTAISLGLLHTCEDTSEDLEEAAFIRSIIARSLE